MTAHWFYNLDNVAKVSSGGIRGYVNPPHPHLESSMMWNFHTTLSDASYELDQFIHILVNINRDAILHKLHFQLIG